MGDISGSSMQVDSQEGCFEGLHFLADQTSQDAGKDVAAPADGHAGVSRRINEDASPVGHEGLVSLEHDDELVLACDLDRSFSLSLVF